MSEIPQIIYNYMSIERFEKLLYSGEWQLSNPMHSNDPKERAMEIYGRVRGEEELPAFSCFCRNPNNPMMWHFYGGAYSGVCLGFDTILMKNRFGDSIVFHPMDYLTIQEVGQRSIGKPKESTTDKLKYKYKEWESESEIRTFFNLEECQKKLYPNYPIGKCKEGRFLFGMLQFVTEIHLGDRCVIRHFLQTLIEGKKAIMRQRLESTDRCYKLLNPRCVLFETKAMPDGRIITKQRCPKQS